MLITIVNLNTVEDQNFFWNILWTFSDLIQMVLENEYAEDMLANAPLVDIKCH